MEKFSVDTEKTAEYVAALKALKAHNTVERKKPDPGTCSGCTCESLESLCVKLQKTRDALDALIGKTIEFLEVADEGFDTSDRLEASGMTGGQK